MNKNEDKLLNGGRMYANIFHKFKYGASKRKRQNMESKPKQDDVFTKFQRFSKQNEILILLRASKSFMVKNVGYAENTKT